jgi:hypothetical protein
LTKKEEPNKEGKKDQENRRGKYAINYIPGSNTKNHQSIGDGGEQ